MIKKEFLLAGKLKKIAILGLAILAVLFVGGFFRKDKNPQKGFAIQPLGKGFSLTELGAVSFYQDKLKSYPAPEKFKKLKFDNGPVAVNGTCSDYYYTILIYPENVDYRQSPSGAVLNRAVPCPEGKKFSVEISKSELNVSPAKSYYLIIADQPKEGTWYNPR